jgi:hypothetical protein
MSGGDWARALPRTPIPSAQARAVAKARRVDAILAARRSTADDGWSMR